MKRWLYKGLWWLLIMNLAFGGIYVVKTAQTRAVKSTLVAATTPDMGTGSDLFSFDYDRLEVFAPYTTKAKMADQLGFSSWGLEESVNEGMVHAAFVKDQAVVATLYGYPSALGFDLSLPPGSYSQTVLSDLSYTVTVQDVGNSAFDPLVYRHYHFQIPEEAGHR